jgi:hypothetical protein
MTDAKISEISSATTPLASITTVVPSPSARTVELARGAKA